MSDIYKKVFALDPPPTEEPEPQVRPFDPNMDLAIPEPEPETNPEMEATTEAVTEEAPDTAEDASSNLLDDMEQDLLEEPEAGNIEDSEQDLESKSEAPSLRPVVDIPEIIFRPIAEVVRPEEDDPNEADAPLPRPEPIRPVGQVIAPSADAPTGFGDPVYAREYTAPPTRLGWVGPVFGLFTALAIGSLAYAYMQDTDGISALGLTGLVLAAIIPALAIIILSIALRAFSQSQSRADALAEAAERLTRADRTAAQDVASMSASIRKEIALVDSQLAQSRTEMDTLVAQITRQSADMDRITQTMADRSKATTQAMADHRNAFTGLISDIDEQMVALSDRLQGHKDALSELSQTTQTEITAASTLLDQSSHGLSESGAALDRISSTSQLQIKEAEDRLVTMLDQIGTRTTALDELFKQRTADLSAMADRLAGEDGSTTSLLLDQTDRLSSINAQIQSTETKLAELLESARSIQDQIAARLSDIETSLTEADMRAKDFTADMADRVGDSVAQTRRELSIMEGELRSLQSRMENLKTQDPESPSQEPRSDKRLKLKPLDTDIPPVSSDDLAIPEEPEDDPLGTIEPLDGPMDEVALARPSEASPDVVRRPGDASPSASVFGRGKPTKNETGGWRWRDMLGTIDTPNEDERQAEPAPAPETMNRSGIERPPAGVPLSPPPPQPETPEASDVVARLCEVKLAPSGTVDAATIDLATEARLAGGEAAQSSAIQSRLTPPILHLRGVLSADHDFRLRVESFRQDYHHYLTQGVDPTQLRSELGTAEGRAYLLCAAALMAS